MYQPSSTRKFCLAATFLCLVPLLAPSLRAQTVVATIPITASDVAVNPATSLAYFSSGTVIEIVSEKTNTVTGTIPVNTTRGLEEVAVNPITNRLYATTSQALYVVDTSINQVITTVNVPAVGVAVNIGSDKIYVSDFNSNLYVIDGKTNNIIKDISLPEGVENLAANPATNRIYVAEDHFPGQVVVIDGKSDTVLTTVDDGGDLTFNLGVDYGHNFVYTADQFGTVSVINGATNTLTSTINTGGEPADASVDPVHRMIYVDNAGLNAVQVIDGRTNTIVNTVPVGTSPDYSDIDYFHNLLYVVNESGGVTVMKTR